jgi:hypothetical protein
MTGLMTLRYWSEFARHTSGQFRSRDLRVLPIKRVNGGRRFGSGVSNLSSERFSREIFPLCDVCTGISSAIRALRDFWVRQAGYQMHISREESRMYTGTFI